MLDVFLKVGTSRGGVYLPLDYRPGFMSLIKSAVKNQTENLYEFIYAKRTVKPYTFAVTFGDELKIEGDKIFFTKPIGFKFSSFDTNYEIYVYNYLVREKEVKIYDQSFEVSSIRFVRKKEIKSSTVIFKTLSPVLIRSHENENFYLCPKCENFEGDESFDDAFKFNLNELTKNLIGLDGVDAEFKALKLKRVVVKHMKKYGDLKFPAFTGVFFLRASPEVLNLVNLAGLGSRRSEGFGMIELVKEI